MVKKHKTYSPITKIGTKIKKKKIKKKKINDMKKKKRIKISPIQVAVIVLMCFMVISIVFNIKN